MQYCDWIAEPLSWENDMVLDDHQIQYERKYSTGQSMNAVSLIAREWEKSLTK
jgi:hypothetical protein